MKKRTLVLNELRAQVTELRREKEGSPAKTPRSSGRRRATAIVLLVIACVIAPLALTAVWLNRQVMDTNAYVNTVGPLSSDPAIQSAVANFVTTQLFTKVDAESVVRQSLPPQARYLAGPITDSLRGAPPKKSLRPLNSPGFGSKPTGSLTKRPSD